MDGTATNLDAGDGVHDSDDSTALTHGPPASGPNPDGPAALHVGGAILAGVAVGSIGGAIWVLANYSLDVEMGWLAIPLGAAIGAAVGAGARFASGRWGIVVAVVVALLTMFGAQNFLQREQLFDGIEALDDQWGDLRVPAEPEGDDPTQMRPEGTFVIPPPAIVAVLPTPAFETMEDEVLAVVWEDVPADRLDEIRSAYPDKVAAAEALIASGQVPDLEAAGDGATEEALTLDEARDRYEASADEFDIPKPVAECATPPDFTQPNAQAGLGFVDGVPLILPLADALNGDPVRGDGQEYESPSPLCFGIANAQDQPVETVSWIVGLVLAGWLAARVGSRRRDAVPA
ncbi:MAG: hypothetical protein ACE37B_23780 [Ilumatobacter sp.]|uniref:hypothetical protein n=1 Tax=Ilumatobacter sp. TaxID=1967498 RepID=UPI003918E65F